MNFKGILRASTGKYKEDEQSEGKEWFLRFLRFLEILTALLLQVALNGRKLSLTDQYIHGTDLSEP